MMLRSIHLASVLLFLLANLLVALFVLPSPALGEQEPEPVQPVYLFTYPRGSTPELISDMPGDQAYALKGEMGAYGGIVTIPVTAEIYFYDLNFDNIKVIDPTNGSLLRLVDGARDETERSYLWDTWPWDMVVSPDGTITVLIERRDESLDFRRLSPGDTIWTQIVRVKPSALFQKRIAGHSYHLNVGPDGTVYIYFDEYYQSMPVDTLATLASEQRLSEVKDHAIPGVVGADGFFYEEWIRRGQNGGTEEVLTVRDRNRASIRSLPGTQGVLLGVSRNGYLAFEGMQNVVINPVGEITATFRYLRTQSKPVSLLAGLQSGFFLSPDGMLYSCEITQEGLEVYLHWREE